MCYTTALLSLKCHALWLAVNSVRKMLYFYKYQEFVSALPPKSVQEVNNPRITTQTKVKIQDHLLTGIMIASYKMRNRKERYLMPYVWDSVLKTPLQEVQG